MWPVSNNADQTTELTSGGLVDGVLLIETQLDDLRVNRLVETGVPIAMIGRTRNSVGIPFVDIDFKRTVENGLDYLTSFGKERIALVAEEVEGSPMAGHGAPIRTEQTFRESMTRRGLNPIVVRCEETPTGGRSAAAALIGTGTNVTAILVMNEVAALGIVSGLSHAGLAVPADVSFLSMVTSPEIVRSRNRC